jgi:hypothetical protein
LSSLLPTIKNARASWFGGDGSSWSCCQPDAYRATTVVSLKARSPAVDGKPIGGRPLKWQRSSGVLNQALSNGAKLTEVHAEYIITYRSGERRASG